MLVDGPAVLGWEEWRRIDAGYALGMIRAALEANIAAGNLPGAAVRTAQPSDPRLNEAALAVAAAAGRRTAGQEFVAAVDLVLDALRASVRAGRPDAPSRVAASTARAR